MIHEMKGNRREAALHLCYGGWDRDLEPGIRYGPVIRDTYIIECCTGGYGSVIINGTEFPIQGGDCYILLPGDTVIHTADAVEPRRGVYCSIDGLRAGSYLAAAGITSTAPFAPSEAFATITELVEKLVRMKDDGDAGVSLRKLACMYEIFGTLLSFSDAVPERNDLIQKAIDFMEDCYYEPLSMEQIAAKVGLERCYFSTVFKSQTGMTPYQYLSQLRIQKACALLQHSHCTVTTAAVSVGIAPENFSRVFKKWIHMSPADYKKHIVISGSRKENP